MLENQQHFQIYYELAFKKIKLFRFINKFVISIKIRLVTKKYFLLALTDYKK